MKFKIEKNIDNLDNSRCYDINIDSKDQYIFASIVESFEDIGFHRAKAGEKNALRFTIAYDFISEFESLLESMKTI